MSKKELITLRDLEQAVLSNDIVWQRSRNCKIMTKAMEVILDLCANKRAGERCYLFEIADAYNDLSELDFYEFLTEFNFNPIDVEIAVSEEVGNAYSNWIYLNQK